MDHDFSDVVDALILVDLVQMDPRLMERYMGQEKAVSFLRFHHKRDVAQYA